MLMFPSHRLLLPRLDVALGWGFYTRSGTLIDEVMFYSVPFLLIVVFLLLSGRFDETLARSLASGGGGGRDSTRFRPKPEGTLSLPSRSPLGDSSADILFLASSSVLAPLPLSARDVLTRLGLGRHDSFGVNSGVRLHLRLPELSSRLLVLTRFPCFLSSHCVSPWRVSIFVSLRSQAADWRGAMLPWLHCPNKYPAISVCLFLAVFLLPIMLL